MMGEVDWRNAGIRTKLDLLAIMVAVAAAVIVFSSMPLVPAEAADCFKLEGYTGDDPFSFSNYKAGSPAYDCVKEAKLPTSLFGVAVVSVSVGVAITIIQYIDWWNRLENFGRLREFLAGSQPDYTR